MLSYPARLIPQAHGRVMLILPDVPDVTVVADDEDEAFARAPAALEAAPAGYLLERRGLPIASDICGAPLVSTDKFSAIGVD